MKIALIQPPSGTPALKVPPLGLGYITAVLKRSHIEAKVIDLNVENISLSTYLSREKPEVVGVSSIVTNARQALEIARKTKNILPKSFVVLGGPYLSMMGDRLVTRHKEVDATLRGEAEFTFPELIKRLRNGESLDDVEGLIFREDDEIKSNSPSNPIDPLDQIPYPAREELKMELYGENAGSIFTSRGCPYQCIFCSRPVFGRKWRGHSPDYVLGEIQHLREYYGISNLSVLDDNFTVDSDRAERILDGIIAKKWKLNLYFWNGIRVDHMTRNLLLKMRKTGCTAINYGVESVDPEVISFIRKGVSLDQVEKTIRLTREIGIRANIFLMLGNPGDTAKVADKIMAFVGKVQVDGVHLSMATPLLGTKFWDWVEKNGCWLDYDREELLDWPIDDVDESYPVFETPDFTTYERIKAYRKTRNLLKEKGLLI
ncbi:MAG: B12-binding domain-containing radical SAM protein [Candidatus Bathyarchaeum sp.]|nr:MAG: B12-binding domain-containing radical SAM protein [Candidatus Bathyarchaeum sp.]